MEYETGSKQERFSLTWYGWVWGALFLIVGAIPLCMYLRIVSISPEVQEFWTGQAETFDFFSFYRSRWIILLTAIGLISFLGRFSERLRTWYSLPLAVYVFFVIASTIFSQRPFLALDGAPGRCEGTLVLLSYVGITFLCMNETRWPTFPKKLLTAILVGGTIVCLIGFAQFMDHDPFRTHKGKLLIMPEAVEDRVQSLAFQVANGFIYSTLPNQNYVGSLATILMAISFGFVWFTRGKRSWLFWALHFLVYVNWLGCRSRAGFVGGILALIIVLALGRNRIWQNVKLIGLLLLAYGMIAFWMDYISLKTPKSQRLFSNFERHLEKPPLFAEEFKDLKLATNSFDISFASEQMHCEFNDGNMEFRNRKGQIVPYERIDQTIKFPKDQFLGFTVDVATEPNVFQISRFQTTINLVHTKQGFMFIDDRLRPVRFREIKRYGFEGQDRFGNGRGFVWARSLPLLWQAAVLGYGPDMFLFHFPQDDYLAKLRAGYPAMLRFDKPHNMFLQIGINTGGISLLATLILFGAYIVQSFCIFWRAKFKDIREIYGVCIVAAVSGYLVTAIFNDSTVSVAPVFWALLGTGIGLNLILTDRSIASAPELVDPTH